MSSSEIGSCLRRRQVGSNRPVRKLLGFAGLTLGLPGCLCGLDAANVAVAHLRV